MDGSSSYLGSCTTSNTKAFIYTVQKSSIIKCIISLSRCFNDQLISRSQLFLLILIENFILDIFKLNF